MDLAFPILASICGIARTASWRVEKAARCERAWLTQLQVHSYFVCDYGGLRTPGSVMMSIEGVAKNEKVNKGIILIHPSSVWASSPPGKLLIILASSTSSRCSTVLISGSRPFGPSLSLNSTQAISVSQNIVWLSKVWTHKLLGNIWTVKWRSATQRTSRKCLSDFVL